jgi:nucleoside-diphosphate-sugar epimerase
VTPTRDLTFVTDTADALLRIADTEALSGLVTNIGTNTEISIAALIDAIAAILGVKAEVESDPRRVRPPASEVHRLVCDNRRLAAATGWAPAVPLGPGLERTIEWFRQRATPSKALTYTV